MDVILFSRKSPTGSSGSMHVHVIRILCQSLLNAACDIILHVCGNDIECDNINFFVYVVSKATTVSGVVNFLGSMP